MTEEVIKEVITSSPAPAAPRSVDQLMSSPDTTYGNNVLPDLKRKEKPVPHYLRASTRSCHDNCKFGTHHSPEPKKRWPVLRAQLSRASTGNQETGRVEIILPKRAKPGKDQQLKISKAGNGTAPAKPESTNSKAPQDIVPDHSENIPCIEDMPAETPEPEILPTGAECFVISHDDVSDLGNGDLSDGAESIELEMPLAIQDSDGFDEQIDDAILHSQDVCEAKSQSPVNDVFDQSENECLASEKMISQNMSASKKRDQADPETESKRSATKPVKPTVKATSSVARNTVSSQKTGRTSHTKASVAEIQISAEAKPMRTKANANVTTSTTTTKISTQRKVSPAATTAAPKVKEIKAPSPYNATDSSAKPARLAKLKVLAAKNAPSPSLSSEKQTDRTMAAKIVAKNAQVLQKERGEKVTSRPLKLSRSINMPAKSISSIKVRSVKKEKIAPPIKSSKKASGTERSAADEKEKITKTGTPKMRTPEVNNKESRPGKEKSDIPTPRRRTTRVSKPATITSTTQSPHKLTFRRGKVLNPEDSSSSTPRRLRFRPTMAAAEATVRSRGGRATGKGGGRGAAGARDAGTSRAEVVVLRRRRDGNGVDGAKRQEQVLLNNVIEETASRLVADARKSKVKALVGAFETVIGSLQEGGKAGPSVPAAVTK